MNDVHHTIPCMQPQVVGWPQGCGWPPGCWTDLLTEPTILPYTLLFFPILDLSDSFLTLWTSILVRMVGLAALSKVLLRYGKGVGKGGAVEAKLGESLAQYVVSLLPAFPLDQHAWESGLCAASHSMERF